MSRELFTYLCDPPGTTYCDTCPATNRKQVKCDCGRSGCTSCFKKTEDGYLCPWCEDEQ